MKNIDKAHKVISEDHQDWRAFSNQAHNGVLFTNFAYKGTDEKMQEAAKQIPPGYEMFLMSDHVTDSNEASFRCVAFLNKETKEIVFATAGTRPHFNKKGRDDLYDDALLVAQSKPAKMNPAQILNDMILDSLGEQAKDYKFHYTGHSLGAAMAEMQAIDMDIKLQKRGLKNPGEKDQITAVTFENPGTKPIVEKMYKEAGLPENSAKKLNFCVFNNRKNIINSLNEQSGTVYTIIPHSQKERNPTLVQMVFEVVAKYASEITPLLGKVFSLLAPGGIGMELPSDHSLSNFNKVFVQKAGKVKDKEGNIISMQEAYTQIKPIEYEENLASKIKNLQQTEKTTGKVEFSMDKFDEATGKLDRITFSRAELEKATKVDQVKDLSSNEKTKFTSRFSLKPQQNIAKQIISSRTESLSPNLKLPSAKQALMGTHRAVGHNIT